MEISGIRPALPADRGKKKTREWIGLCAIMTSILILVGMMVAFGVTRGSVTNTNQHMHLVAQYTYTTPTHPDTRSPCQVCRMTVCWAQG